jgi:Pyruvate/2-oxoacid:ferredoxin oxidoreductase delta subunit
MDREMMVSKCCKKEVHVENNTISYYVCSHCGLCADLVLQDAIDDSRDEKKENL